VDTVYTSAVYSDGLDTFEIAPSDNEHVWYLDKRKPPPPPTPRFRTKAEALAALRDSVTH
jgi:hypothetical protein